MDPIVQNLLERYGQQKTNRAVLEATLQQLCFYVWPSADRLVEKQAGGQIYTTHLADTTAIQAAIRMSAGIISYLMPAGIRWFEFRPEEEEEAYHNFAVQKELAWQTQAVHAALWRSNFQREMFTAIRSIVVFGTACISVEETGGNLIFHTHPIQDVFFEEDAKRQIQTVWRRYQYTTKQIIDLFGLENLPSDWKTRTMTASELSRSWEVVHAVFPAEDYEEEKLDKLRWRSLYILTQNGHILEDGRFATMPYMIGRYDRSPGEQMGRSPAMELLPDIKMLNQMRKTFLRSSEMVSCPPIIVDDDPMMEQPVIGPGSILVRSPGGKDPTPLPIGVNPALTAEVIELERKNIRDGFFNDLFQALADFRNMTAFEVAQRIEEKMTMLSPILSGLQKELLDPLILRVRQIVLGSQKGTPYVLSRNRRVKVVYQSRLAMGMSATQTNAMELWLTRWLPLQGIHPILDVIDIDKAAQRAALFSGVPADLLRSEEEIGLLREQRQAAEEQIRQIQMAQSASEAVKNVVPAAKFMNESKQMGE